MSKLNDLIKEICKTESYKILRLKHKLADLLYKINLDNN